MKNLTLKGPLCSVARLRLLTALKKAYCCGRTSSSKMNSDRRRRARVQGVGWAAANSNSHTQSQYVPFRVVSPSGSQSQQENLHPHHPFTAGSMPQREVRTTTNFDFLSHIASLRLKNADSVSQFPFNKKRVRNLSNTEDIPSTSQGVMYWMSRDQRVQDNWALLYAQSLAIRKDVPLHVCFCMVPEFLGATYRQYAFMLKGLEEVEQECTELGISFHLLIGYAKDVLPKFVTENHIGGLVADFSPLRDPLQWVDDVKTQLTADVYMCQVDAHNIVPCWEAADDQVGRAYLMRERLYRQLPEYLTEYPPVVQHPHKLAKMPEAMDWEAVLASLKVDRIVGEVDWAIPGTVSGHKQLESFINHRLMNYSSLRNDPTTDFQSNLSPWFHFGQISVQRAILMLKPYESQYNKDVEKFKDEAIVWREMADNLCFYNKQYDSIKGTSDWAQQTLDDHRQDRREYVYSREQLESASTHDDLWNAAQIQIMQEGKMHGFLRMYWAKKILEWTDTPERALRDAIYLNDKYNLDGRDPNGFAGCMWAICGMHDRDFAERPIYGKIRFMTYAGSQRKFNVAAVVRKYQAKKY